MQTAAKPILEVNATHPMIRAIAAKADPSFREDASFLLLDQARILDGDKPADPRAFAERLQRIFEKLA